MAEDIFGRTFEPIDVGIMANSLKGAVEQVVETTSPMTDEKLDNLYSAINAVASRIDDSARKDLDSAQDFVSAITTMDANIRSGYGSQKQEHQPRIAASLSRIDLATQVLAKASKDRRIIIDRIATGAQRDIKAAILSAGCCGGRGGKSSEVGQVIGAMKDVFDSEDVAQGTSEGITKSLEQYASQSSGKGIFGGGDGNIAELLENGPGKSWGVWFIGLQSAHKVLTMMSQQWDSLFDISLEHMMPALKGLNRWRETVRHIVFMQSGMGNLNRELEEDYRDIDIAVSSTGIKRSQFAAIWMENLNRGFLQERKINKVLDITLKKEEKQLILDEKHQKVRSTQIKSMLSVTASAISTAQLLNMGMEETNALFMDWHMHLGMSASQIGAMGRNMLEVSRQSGIIGTNLQDAMKSATDFAEKMRAAGTFQAGDLKQFTLLFGRLEQLGVSDVGKEFTEGMIDRNAFESSRFAGLISVAAAHLTEAHQKELGVSRSFVLDIMTGGFTDSLTNQKAMGVAMEDHIRSWVMGVDKQGTRLAGILADLGFDVENMDMTHITDAMQRVEDKGRVLVSQGLEDEGQAMINAANFFRTNFKGAFEMGMGDYERVSQAYQGVRNQGKIIDELSNKIKKMQKDRKEGTDEYAAAIADQYRFELSAQIDIWKIIQKKSSGPLGLNTDAVDAALFKIRDRLGDTFADPLGELSTEKLLASSDRLFDSIEAQAAALDFDTDAWFKTAGLDIGTLKADLATGDSKKIEDVMMSLNYMFNEMDKKARTDQDPLTRFRMKLNQLAQMLAERLEPLLDFVINYVDQIFYLSMIATAVTGILAGTWLSKILLGFAGKQLATLAQIPKLLGIKTGGGLIKTGGLLGKAGGVLGKAGGVLGKIAGPAGMILSGILGGKESEAAGKSFAEGAGFGMLTGSGTSKSILGDLFGIEEGSGGDKALAITEAAAYGALIGSVFPVIGTAAGAVIGGLVKIIQMLGEKFQWVADMAGIIINPLGSLIEGIWNMLKGVWDILAGIVTLDFGRVLEGIKKILWDGLVVGISKAVWHVGQGIWKSLAWIIQGIIVGIMKIPSILASLFTDFGPWLYGVILDGLKSLASNEWVGPIFKPLLAIWETIGEVFGPIFETFGDVFAEISKALEPAIKAVSEFFDSIRSFFGIEKAAGGLEGIMDFLGWAFKGLAIVLGFLIKWALFPIIRALKVFGFAFKVVQFGIQKIIEVFMGVTSPLKAISDFAKNVWEGVTKLFSDLYNYLIGNSLIPDLINGIIKWFNFLITPFKIFREGLKMIGGILSGVWQIIKGVFTLDVKSIGRGFKKIFNSIWKGIVAIPKMLWSAIFGESEEGASGIAGIFGAIPGILWDAFLFIPTLLFRALSGIGSFIWKFFKNALGGVGKMLGDAWTYLKDSSFAEFGTWLYDTTISALAAAWNWFKNKFSIVEAASAGARGAAAVANLMGQGAAGAAGPVGAAAGAAIKYAKDNQDIKESMRDSNRTFINTWRSMISDQNKRFENAANAAAEVAEIEGSLVSTRRGLMNARRESLSYDQRAGMWTDGLSGAEKLMSDIAHMQEGFLEKRVGDLERRKRQVLETIENSPSNARPIIDPTKAGARLEERGAFERGGSQEAIMLGVQHGINSITGIGPQSTLLAPQGEVEKLEKATQDYRQMLEQNPATLSRSLEYGTSASESAEKNIVNELSKASDMNKEASREQSESQQNMVAELSRALDYEKRGSEAAESGIIAETDAVGAGVSSVGMDYSDVIKPIVSTILTSRNNVEERLEQRRAGETSGSAAVMLPSMDSISEYLSRVQSGKLDEMIAVLNDIKIKMGESSPQTIGARGGGVPATGRPGIKRIAQDYTRGHWDLMYGDNAPGSSEGKGGK